MTQVEIDERVRYGDPDPRLVGGVCGDCYSCREPEVSDLLDEAARRALADVGVCAEAPDEPVLVSRREWHPGGLDGCWGPA